MRTACGIYMFYLNLILFFLSTAAAPLWKRSNRESTLECDNRKQNVFE